MHVVICGGGVIGTAIAYFLSRRGVQATVVERTGVACAASGKSGGFLALDWCDGTPLEELARRSFALHAALADEIRQDFGYRRLTTFAGHGSAVRGAQPRARHALDWLSENVSLQQRLGSPDTTAQVHPGAFTSALMSDAQAHGTELRHGEVSGLVWQGERVAGVELDSMVVEADAVVIAMGPWSILAAQWMRLPPVFGLKGHSLVFATGTQVTADALFLEFQETRGSVQSPEIFPRSDGTTYVCAISSHAPLPVDPAAVVADAGAIERLEAMCRALSPVLANATIVARQACFRPVTEDGLPLIGAIPACPGAYVATGHSVWGILNAPATGEAMAALICGEPPAIDLTPFRPDRLRPVDPQKLNQLPVARR